VDTPELNGTKSTDLRARLEKLASRHPSGDGYEHDSWSHAKAVFAEAWENHKERWPRSDQKPRRPELSPTVARELETGCDRIKAAESEITTKLRSIEAQQPGRALVGLGFCLKGRERVIQKASEYMREMPGFAPSQALAMVPDPIRYTFMYETDDYSGGVQLDIDRLKAEGCEMIKLKNYWGNAEYKGINSQWRDSTGQRFEVQFHTSISFECKQLTHSAYERLRNPADIADRRELRELHKLQRDITSKIPEPPGTNYISDQA
jgi:hypothetical protein